jgi:hypothetical protein
MERTWDICHPSPRTTGLVEGQKNGLAIPSSLQIAPDDRRGLAASSFGLDHGVPCAPFGPSLVRKRRCLRRTPKKHVDEQKNMCIYIYLYIVNMQTYQNMICFDTCQEGYIYHKQGISATEIGWRGDTLIQLSNQACLADDSPLEVLFHWHLRFPELANVEIRR